MTQQEITQVNGRGKGYSRRRHVAGLMPDPPVSDSDSLPNNILGAFRQLHHRLSCAVC